MWPKRELEAGPIWREGRGLGSQCPLLANHQAFDVLVYFLFFGFSVYVWAVPSI